MGKFNLSIIVSVYNNERHIRETLLSILEQIEDDVQVIVVNDGSNDDTLDEVYKVINEHPRGHQIIVVNQGNRGLSESRNIGLDMASGPYVSFLDGDDILLPNFYRKISEIITNSSCKPDMIEFNAIRFSDNDQEDYFKPSLFKVNVIGDYAGKTDEETINKIFSHAYWFTWARVYNKKMFENISFPSELSYEDMIVTPKLYLAAKYIVGLSEPLVGYRMNLGSVTKNPTDKHVRDIEKIIDHYLVESAREIDPFRQKMLFLVACQCTIFYKTILNDKKGYWRSLKDIRRVVNKVKKNRKFVEVDLAVNTKMLLVSPPLSNLYSYMKSNIWPACHSRFSRNTNDYEVPHPN